MKSLMKIAIVKAILFLMTTSALAQTANTQQAFNYFYDAGGNTGFANVYRSTDPVTKITTTTLSYSFCVQTTAPSCLEGSGVIPNSAFVANLNGDYTRAQVLKVLFDTTTPGFVNELCNGPDPYAGCSFGRSPATGGLISLVWVTKRGYIDTFLNTHSTISNYKLTLNATDRISQGQASVKGSVIGAGVDNTTAVWIFEQLSGKGSPGSKVALEHSIAPQALRRLQRLRGDNQ